MKIQLVVIWSRITVMIRTSFCLDQFYFFYGVGRQFSMGHSVFCCCLMCPKFKVLCHFSGLSFRRVPSRDEVYLPLGKREGSAHKITRFPQSQSSSTMRSTLLHVSSAPTSPSGDLGVRETEANRLMRMHLAELTRLCLWPRRHAVSSTSIQKTVADYLFSHKDKLRLNFRNESFHDVDGFLTKMTFWKRKYKEGSELGEMLRSENVLCWVVFSHSVMSDSVTPMDCSPPGSSVHGGSPGKNTQVGCMPSSRRSS